MIQQRRLPRANESAGARWTRGVAHTCSILPCLLLAACKGDDAGTNPPPPAAAPDSVAFVSNYGAQRTLGPPSGTGAFEIRREPANGILRILTASGPGITDGVRFLVVLYGYDGSGTYPALAENGSQRRFRAQLLSGGLLLGDFPDSGAVSIEDAGDVVRGTFAMRLAGQDPPPLDILRVRDGAFYIDAR